MPPILHTISAFDALDIFMGAFLLATGLIAWIRLIRVADEFPWPVFAIIYLLLISPGVGLIAWGLLRVLGAHL